ncbi:MAG: hypothetical protein ACYTEQ_03560 [Planctomycetota bacterium]
MMADRPSGAAAMISKPSGDDTEAVETPEEIYSKSGATDDAEEPEAEEEDAEEEEAEQPEADPDEEENEEDEEEPEEESIETEKIEGLSEASQQKVDRRIGKAVKKQREAEERAEAAEAKLEEQKDQLGPEDREAAYGLGLHPSYVNKNETALLKKDTELGEKIAWCVEHFDGYKPEDGEGKEYSAIEVRRRYSDLNAEREGIRSRAASLYDERHNQMIADMELGRKTRLAKEKLKQKATKGKGKKKKPAKVVPGVSATSKRSVSSGKTKTLNPFDGKKIADKGGGAEAMRAAYEEAFS